MNNNLAILARAFRGCLHDADCDVKRKAIAKKYAEELPKYIEETGEYPAFEDMLTDEYMPPDWWETYAHLGKSLERSWKKKEAWLERIKLLTSLEKKGIFELLASASEELGEVSRELKIEHAVHGNTYKEPGEGSKAESVDLAICALALYFASGGTQEELGPLMHKKLDKWEETQQQ